MQEYLTGKEFTVAALGNVHPGAHVRLLPVLEIDYSGLPDSLPPIQLYGQLFSAKHADA